MRRAFTAVLLAGLVLAATDRAGAGPQARQSDHESVAAAPAAPALPPGYLIGADDVLAIVYWREKDMSAEVTVRPDGKVALPLLNELQAAGLTPDDFRDRVVAAARQFIEEPNPTVMVKTINSRRVFITGQVEKPGPYPLNNSATVLQLIAMAGGLKEFAKGKNISVLRFVDGAQVVHRFNYQDALNRRNLEQNIALQPGDTVLVP
ncbi:MAG: polysaccharide biosynthesis/export family protein [Vicinamibacterales bacterium]|jgi:polysaccharide export outer membrane protein